MSSRFGHVPSWSPSMSVFDSFVLVYLWPVRAWWHVLKDIFQTALLVGHQNLRMSDLNISMFFFVVVREQIMWFLVFLHVKCVKIMTQKDQRYLLDIILVGTFTPLGWSKTPPSSHHCDRLRSGTIVVTWRVKGEPQSGVVFRGCKCVSQKNKPMKLMAPAFFLGGGGFKNFCFFSPWKIGEDVSPFFDSYFSDGLKPPTSILLVRCFFWLILFLDTLWKVWKSWKRK